MLIWSNPECAMTSLCLVDDVNASVWQWWKKCWFFRPVLRWKSCCRGTESLSDVVCVGGVGLQSRGEMVLAGDSVIPVDSDNGNSL